MSRLRYIADNPRGPRGGNHDARVLYKSPDSAQRAVLVVKGKAVGQVMVVDIDALLPVPRKDETSAMAMDRTYAWHAARAQYHASEMARLRPIGEALHPDVMIANDADQVGRVDEAGIVRTRALLASTSGPQWLTSLELLQLREVVSEWDIEENRLRRGGGDGAARQAFFVLRDLLRAGKLGGPR